MTDKETRDVPDSVTFLVGNKEMVTEMQKLPVLKPFADEVLDMLNDVSRLIIANREAKQYPDVITYAFWIRRSSTLRQKEHFHKEDGNIRLGRGVAFHIAPSNVPVNFAYSLAAGLLTGNANIVRVSSKDFPQVKLIADAFAKVLESGKYGQLAGYVCIVRYGREKEINDLFSAFSDTRIIWGGDATVREIRRSPLAPRAGEVTFADRFSIAVIDSNAYVDMSEREKQQTAEGFYNDTYLTDQNACTSPRLVAWVGDRKEEAKEAFWGRLHELVKKKYTFQPIQGVNKLASSCLTAAVYASEGCAGVKVEMHDDNLIIRVSVPELMKGLMSLKDNSGYFFEYDCEDILELRNLCDDKQCQTVAYIGKEKMLEPLLASGIHGVDRIVSVGKTMDFELIWDGYNLYERLMRIIKLN